MFTVSTGCKSSTHPPQAAAAAAIAVAALITLRGPFVCFRLQAEMTKETNNMTKEIPESSTEEKGELNCFLYHFKYTPTW